MIKPSLYSNEDYENEKKQPSLNYRPLVYVCSPYAGDIEANIENARKYSRFVVDMGCIPVTPHLLYPQFLDDAVAEERNLGMFFGYVLMDKCREIWVFGETISSGMAAEISRARLKGYQIRYFTSDLTETSNNFADEIKAIQTNYKGYLFRSRLEARWAVFFDACGIDWEYEPEGYDLGDGLMYLPDFLLHDVAGRAKGDLYVEVKGKMSDIDAMKIRKFSQTENRTEYGYEKSETAVLVVGTIPPGDISDITEKVILEASADDGYPHKFSFETIDGEPVAAHPGINKDGKFEVFTDLENRDEEKTELAFRYARQARFEYGETPKF